MTTHNQSFAHELDIEQDVNDVKVVPARKGVENLGFGGNHTGSLFDSSKSMWSPSEKFGSPDKKKSEVSKQFDLQNENNTKKEQSPRKFNPKASAFRSAESGFSKTPGPGSKPARTQFDPIDLQTPSKTSRGAEEGPTDGLAFKLFEGDDHTWTQARNTLHSELQEPSMTPLMNSMLGQFLDTSPVPTHRNAYKHSPDAAPRQLEAESSLDMRNLAINFDSVVFPSSLNTTNNTQSAQSAFSLADPSTINISTTGNNSNGKAMRASREGPLYAADPFNETNLADMHFEIDRLSMPSTHTNTTHTNTTHTTDATHTTDYHTGDLDERPAVWQPTDTFGFSRTYSGNTNSGDAGTSVARGGVSQSLPHLPSYYRGSSGSGGAGSSGVGMRMQGSLLHDADSTATTTDTNIFNINVHNSWAGGSNFISAPAPDAAHDPYHQPYFAPKVQNWMDGSGVGDYGMYDGGSGVPNPLQGSISNVDEFNALSSNLADNFARQSVSNNNNRASYSSNTIHAHPTYSSSSHSHTLALAQESQFAVGPQFNASAPAFHPRSVHNEYAEYSEYGSVGGSGASGSGTTSGVNSNRDSWDSLHSAHPAHTTHSTLNTHPNHLSHPSSHPNPAYKPPYPTNPAMLRPPQTHYEPPLPTTTGIRVGKPRNEYRVGGNSGGSIGNSTEGLRSSGESEGGSVSRMKHPLHNTGVGNSGGGVAVSNSGGVSGGVSGGGYVSNTYAGSGGGGQGYGYNHNYPSAHQPFPNPHPAHQPFPNPHLAHNPNINTHPSSSHSAHPTHSTHPMHPSQPYHTTTHAPYNNATHPTHAAPHPLTGHHTQVVREVNKNAFPRVEVVESAQGKQYYKEFHRVFLNLKEKHELGYHKQRKHALTAIEAGPQDVKWRIHLDLADLYKRNNFMDEARQHFAQVCRLQPRAATGWLEWSKMDEENGKIRVALEILLLGLKVCPANEMLLTKAIKLNERLHKYSDARGMLSKLKHESIDKVWKSVLEGALFEARTGNVMIARKLFKYLISHVPWYGPIYFEAFRLEEKEHRDDAAYEIILRGLNELPRYGPLWFGLFRIMERKDAAIENRAWQQGSRPKLMHMVHETSRAVRLISKELTWKVHFERSQCEERAAEIAALGKHLHSTLTLQQCRDEMLRDARLSLTRSLLTCPGNLRWRVLLVGARLELGVGAIDKARALLRRAAKEVPVKSKSYVYLECSRVEEYCGNLDTARVLLARAKREQEGEWKLFLESVLIEARAGLIERAAFVAQEAVQAHDGTGRLWAIYIQLCHRLEVKYFYDTEAAGLQSRLTALCGRSENTDATTGTTTITTSADKQWLSKSHIILQAITLVPKSGEVWCERGRCQLNPLSAHCFDLSQAQRSLCFAIQFTPQYGDSFVEYVRLEMLCQVLLPRVLELLGLPVVEFVRTFLSEDPESDLVEITHDSQRVTLAYDSSKVASVPCGGDVFASRGDTIVKLERMQYDFGDLSEQYSQVVVRNLNRRSVNADPNYGSAWFHCRQQPYDVPSTVLLTALGKITHEVSATQEVYARAMLHYIRRCVLGRAGGASKISGGGGGVSSGAVSNGSGGVNVDSAVNAILSSPTRSASAPPTRPKQNTTMDVSKSQDGLRAHTTSNTPSNTRNTPSPYQLTAMGGRRSPLREALHTASQEEVEPEEVRATREAELLEQMNSVNTAMLRLNSTVIDTADTATTAPGTVATSADNTRIANTTPPTTRNTSHWACLNTIHITPFVSLSNHSVFCSTDFITGLVEMNRLMYNSNMSDELRRKNLFGSDQIIS